MTTIRTKPALRIANARDPVTLTASHALQIADTLRRCRHIAVNNGHLNEDKDDYSVICAEGTGRTETCDFCDDDLANQYGIQIGDKEYGRLQSAYSCIDCAQELADELEAFGEQNAASDLADEL